MGSGKSRLLVWRLSFLVRGICFFSVGQQSPRDWWRKRCRGDLRKRVLRHEVQPGTYPNWRDECRQKKARSKAGVVRWYEGKGEEARKVVGGQTVLVGRLRKKTRSGRGKFEPADDENAPGIVEFIYLSIRTNLKERANGRTSKDHVSWAKWTDHPTALTRQASAANKLATVPSLCSSSMVALHREQRRPGQAAAPIAGNGGKAISDLCTRR